MSRDLDLISRVTLNSQLQYQLLLPLDDHNVAINAGINWLKSPRTIKAWTDLVYDYPDVWAQVCMVPVEVMKS